MTVRSKAFFTTGQPVTTNPKFRTNNKPREDTFIDLFDSIPFKAETADTASESVHGLVKLATGEEVFARTNTRNGYQLVVRPSHIPDVGVPNEDQISSVTQTSSAGIRIDKVQLTESKRIQYWVNLLFDTNYFKSNNSEELTMSNGFITAWTALLGLLNNNNDGINITPADFEIEAFDGGGIVNDGGVFTVDTDDSTMHIDAVTKKVQIKDGGVTLDKLQNLNAGEIIVAPTGGGTPEIISLLGEGKILVGSPTGLQVKDINDYLLSIAISDNSIKARKLDPGTLGDGITKDMAASDASKLKVNLSSAASLEFDGGALQLKNDEASPSKYSVYSYVSSKQYNNLFALGVPLQRTIVKSLAVGPQSVSLDAQVDILQDTDLKLEVVSMFDLKVFVNTGLATYSEIFDHSVDLIDDGSGNLDSIGISLTGSGVPITSDYTYYFVFTYKPTLI